MNKIQTFARTFIKSITEPAYYNHILKAKFSFSVKYFLMYYVFFALFSSLVYNYSTKPKLSEFSTGLINEITSNYPTDLVITVENSGLTMEGADDPLNVPIPAFLQDSGLEDEFDYLATITNSIEAPSTNSLITATKDRIIIRTQEGSKETITFESLELADDEVLTLNKNIVNMSTSQLQTILDQIIAYSPIAVFLFTLVFMPVFAALGLLFNSLLTWLISSLMSKNLSYKQSYQIGLHTTTFVSTATLIKDILFPQVMFSALGTIAFLGSTIIALMAIKPLKKS